MTYWYLDKGKIKGSANNGKKIQTHTNTSMIIYACIIQVEPGKPGAEVSKKKNYKSKKEFAYRMCTG